MKYREEIESGYLGLKARQLLDLVSRTNGGPVTERLIVAVVWGDRPPLQYHKTLRAYFGRIKMVTGIGCRFLRHERMWMADPHRNKSQVTWPRVAFTKTLPDSGVAPGVLPSLYM